MRCTCPVCNQSCEYAEIYAFKWHRCKAGCGPAGLTRMVVVPDGIGINAEQLDSEWWRATQRGRWARALVALAALPLLTTPWLGPELGFELPWLAYLLLAGVGASLVSAYAHAAWA